MTLSAAKGFLRHAAPKPRQIARAVIVGGQKVVLFAWGTSIEPRLRNVAAIGRDGSTTWIAELPAGTGHDCFVKLEGVGRWIFATTFSGRVIRLCPETGEHVAQG